MAKITFTDKEALNIEPDIPAKNKIQATDVNQIKTVVNQNDDDFIATTKYSTTEVKTGMVWINNKPIYRKVVSMGALLNADSLVVAHGISNIEFIVNAIMFAIRESDSDRLPVPYATFNANNSGGLNGYANATNVVITTSSNRTTYNGYAILEYTKTTD